MIHRKHQTKINVWIFITNTTNEKINNHNLKFRFLMEVRDGGYHISLQCWIPNNTGAGRVSCRPFRWKDRLHSGPWYIQSAHLSTACLYTHKHSHCTAVLDWCSPWCGFSMCGFHFEVCFLLLNCIPLLHCTSCLFNI